MTKTPPSAPGVSTEPAPKKAPKTDWEAIERDYRAGVLSIREVGRQHGVSHTAINKEAKAKGWVRDLTEKVQKGVKAALVANEVSNHHAHGNERQIVETAVGTCVALVREHRRDIAGGRQMAEMLLGQLQFAAENRDLLEDFVIDETAGDKKTERRAAMLKLIALPAHAGVLRDLTVALKNLIPLERQAFNLEAMPPPEPPAKPPEPPEIERMGRLDSRFGRFARLPVTIEQ